MFGIGKKKIKTKGKGNQVLFEGCSSKNLLGKSSLNINGKNNQVVFDHIKRYRDSRIKIEGNNNTVKFAENGSGILSISILANNCTVEIGKNSSFSGTEIHLWENGSRVIIGNDCIFAGQTCIYCTDFHSVTDAEGKPLNQGREIIIGNHCWSGSGAKILKNTWLADDIIIGAASVVSKSCQQRNVVLAGNPARIVKENVYWQLPSYDKQLEIYLNNNLLRTKK